MNWYGDRIRAILPRDNLYLINRANGGRGRLHFGGVAETCDLVGGDIVHDHDVAGPEGRRQHLLDPGGEASPFIGPSRSIGATKPTNVRPRQK